MFKLKKIATIPICLLLLASVIGCSRGDSSISPTSVSNSTIYWQNFAADQEGSNSVSNLLPSSISLSSLSLESGATSYTSPIVYKDEDTGLQNIIILEYNSGTLTLNKYVYTTSLSFDQTLATFSANETNYEHHQIAMYTDNGTPMIVVGHGSGVDIVNATSSDETSGEVSNSVGATYRVLVDASNSIYVQSANGVYKFNSSLVEQASNTNVTASSLSNRLPIVKIVDSVYFENDITIYELNEGTLNEVSSHDYEKTITDLETEMDIEEDKFYESSHSQKIGAITKVGDQLLVAVIRKLNDTDDDTYWVNIDVTYSTTSYYYHSNSPEVPSFLGTLSDVGSYYKEYMYNKKSSESETNSDYFDQSNVIGHSDITSISVKGSSIYLPINNIADDSTQATTQSSFSNVAQLTTGSSVSSVTEVYSSSAGQAPYLNLSGTDMIYLYQVPTHVISGNTDIFSVMSYDTSFHSDNSELSDAIDGIGTATKTVPSVSTTFMLGDSTVSLPSSVKVSVVSVGNEVVFAIGDDGKIYVLN